MLELTPELAKDWAATVGRIEREIPWRMQDWTTSINADQVRSKYWVAEILKDLMDKGMVATPDKDSWACQIGAWNNSLMCPLLVEKLGYTNLVSMDIDPDSKLIHNACNKRLREQHHIEYKIRDIVFEKPDWAPYNLIVNTSCEHMYPMKDVFEDRAIQEDCVFAFQSANLFSEKGHINCVEYVEELIDQSGLTEILYANELQLSKFRRFMVIGRR